MVVFKEMFFTLVQTPVYPATSQPPASHTTSSAANQPMTECELVNLYM